MNNNINSMNKNIKRNSHSDNKKELLINKFIEKFPKVKLETIIEINKYYNTNKKNIILEDTKIDKIMYEYLMNN